MTIDEARTWLQRHADNTPMPRAREAYRTILDELDGVRRGRWLDGVEGSMLRICSLCGFTAGAPSHRFCPACGAKMEVSNKLAEIDQFRKETNEYPG